MRRSLKAFLLAAFLTVSFFDHSFAKDYNDFLREGNTLYKDKEYKLAIEAYKEAVKLANGKVNVYYNLGLTYKRIKDYPSSVRSFEKYLNGATNKKKIKAAKNQIEDMSAALSRPTTAGKLTHYEIWEGWILIDSDVIIPEDIVLTIKPGALVMFTPLKSKYDVMQPYLDKEDTDYLASLIVRGTLIAEGQSENEILFSNSFEDITAQNIGLWGGIVFEGSKDSVLKFAKIERAKNGIVFTSNPEVDFRNNIFLKNEVSIKLIDESPINLDYNIFYKNDIGIECGDNALATAVNNNFTKNNYAFKVTGRAKPNISKNIFDENNCSICSYDKSFPKIFNNSFTNGKFGVSLTEDAKALIKGNKFSKNKIGINSVNNSSPTISQNEFLKNDVSGINAADNSTAIIEVNTFSDNKVGILKSDSVQVLENKFTNNKSDVKDLD